ncbi:MAG: hypothetical protein QG588_1865, partial [Candidatus Poribacteria bacterium]|nr:hypothetical protein [Candidatus Poribacteria bacterium]
MLPQVVGFLPFNVTAFGVIGGWDLESPGLVTGFAA